MIHVWRYLEGVGLLLGIIAPAVAWSFAVEWASRKGKSRLAFWLGITPCILLVIALFGLAGWLNDHGRLF